MEIGRAYAKTCKNVTKAGPKYFELPSGCLVSPSHSLTDFLSIFILYIRWPFDQLVVTHTHKHSKRHWLTVLVCVYIFKCKTCSLLAMCHLRQSPPAPTNLAGVNYSKYCVYATFAFLVALRRKLGLYKIVTAFFL